MREMAAVLVACVVAGSAAAWPTWLGGRAEPPAVTVAAVGDIMLDRRVARTMQRKGPAGMVVGICHLLSGADLATGNLECPLAEKSGRLEKPIAFRGSPRAVKALVEGGLTVVSLANNHALDCGRDGLRETMGVLAKSGLRWCGAGVDRRAAERPAVIAVRGRRVAFVGFCEFPEGERKWDHTPTIALAEEETVRRVVAEAKDQADSVVASFHWGEEYDDRPNRLQRRLAMAAVEAGADLVVGCHPHVLQGFEVVAKGGRRALVAYSLGNFLFDQKRERTRESVVLRVTLGRGGVTEANLVPVTVDGARPRPATTEEARVSLARLTKLCKQLHTDLKGSALVLP